MATPTADASAVEMPSNTLLDSIEMPLARRQPQPHCDHQQAAYRSNLERPKVPGIVADPEHSPWC
jgi:hypothetical protein